MITRSETQRVEEKDEYIHKEQKHNRGSQDQLHLKLLPCHLVDQQVCLFKLRASLLVLVVDGGDHSPLSGQVVHCVIIDVDNCKALRFDTLELLVLSVELIVLVY